MMPDSKLCPHAKLFEFWLNLCQCLAATIQLWLLMVRAMGSLRMSRALRLYKQPLLAVKGLQPPFHYFLYVSVSGVRDRFMGKCFLLLRGCSLSKRLSDGSTGTDSSMWCKAFVGPVETLTDRCVDTMYRREGASHRLRSP